MILTSVCFKRDSPGNPVCIAPFTSLVVIQITAMVLVLGRLGQDFSMGDQMSNCGKAALLLVLAGLVVSPAHSQQVIKSVSCKGHFNGPNSRFLVSNISPEARRFSVQVVRDGCRPKTGIFVVNWNDSTGARNHFPTRYGRETNRTAGVVNSQGGVVIWFDPLGETARGMFDYVFTKDCLISLAQLPT